MNKPMKKSGVAWIGNIPDNWDTIKNKYLISKMYSGGTPTASNEEFYTLDNGIPFVSISDMSNTLFVDSTKKQLTDSGIKDKNLSILPKGTILYSIYATIGAISELRIEATISQAMLAITLNDKIEKTYYKYCLSAMREFILSDANGNTQFNLNAEKVRHFNFPYPNFDEQFKISATLDHLCLHIDNVIEKTKASIEEYKKLKQAIITQAVTKGVHGNRPMKNSGIEWIGDIPEEWEISKVRYIGSLQNGISKGSEYFGEGYPFISYGDVYRNYSIPDKVTGLVITTEEERKRYSVIEGDIFFTRTSETIEEVGFSAVCEKTISDATFAGFVIRLRPYKVDSVILTGFAKYFFRGEQIRKYLVKEMNLVTRASLGQGLLNAMSVLVPPLREQKEIATYLDQKCAEIDSIITKKEHFFTELECYKKSMIYEYVTGKKEA